jgi:hypothetical protein
MKQNSVKEWREHYRFDNDYNWLPWQKFEIGQELPSSLVFDSSLKVSRPYHPRIESFERTNISVSIGRDKYNLHFRRNENGGEVWVKGPIPAH